MAIDTNTTHKLSDWQETDIGRIPSDWAVTTLGSIAKVLTDGSHFSPKPTSKGRYMASVKDMTYSGFEFSQCKHITEEDYLRLKKAGCSPEHGDILISKDGANCLDIIFTYSQSDEIVLLSSIAILRLQDDYSPSFYTYFLLSSTSQRIMRNWFISGSAIPRVVLKDFKEVPVPRLPLPEQKAIADVLSSLDDKIELIRKQNETLEAIAQTIFKEWFVNFNFPDNNGKPYKASGGKMIDSELGEIPEGWRVGVYENIVEVSTGKGLKKEFISVKGRHLVLGANGALGKTDKYIFNDDLILTGRVGTLGTVNISHNKVWISDNVLISKAKQRESFHFAYFTLQRFNFESLNRGSTQPLITQTDLKSVDVIIPDEGTLRLFSRTTETLFDKIRTNHDQIKTLTRLRDTLLPKLMSGQVRVKT